MTSLPGVRLCLTCGGPADLCARSDRCVGLLVEGVPPPDRFAFRSTRTAPEVTAFGWRYRAAVTAAVWGFGLFAATRMGSSGLPLFVFAGLPYAVAAVAITRALWRPRRVRDFRRP